MQIYDISVLNVGVQITKGFCSAREKHVSTVRQRPELACCVPKNGVSETDHMFRGATHPAVSEGLVAHAEIVYCVMQKPSNQKTGFTWIECQNFEIVT